MGIAGYSRPYCYLEEYGSEAFHLYINGRTRAEKHNNYLNLYSNLTKTRISTAQYGNNGYGLALDDVKVDTSGTLKIDYDVENGSYTDNWGFALAQAEYISQKEFGDEVYGNENGVLMKKKRAIDYSLASRKKDSFSWDLNSSSVPVLVVCANKGDSDWVGVNIYNYYFEY